MEYRLETENLLVGIGERLRQQRKKLGLTQEQTAELLAMSTTFYGELERGHKRISLEKIILVQEKMNLEPTYLLTGKRLTDSIFVEIFNDCPRDKEYLVEQLSRIVALLYK